MAPTATKQPTAGKAADMLWEHQLRRENRAILEHIRQIGEKRDADVTEIMKRFTDADRRRLALEAKVGEMVKEQQLKEAEHKKQCAEKIAQMENLLRSRLTEDEFRKMMADELARLAKVPGRVALSQASQALPAAPLSSRSQGSRAVQAQATTPAVTNKTANPSGSTSRRAMKVANRRPATRSTSSAGTTPQRAPVQAAPPVLTTSSATREPVPAIIPKLAQKGKTLIQYYKFANTAFRSLAIKDTQTEYDFITAFVYGLEKKTCARVIEALVASYPTKNRLQGGVEIQCQWEEIPAAFKDAGLDLEGAKEEIRKKKRTLNPRTQLETGFAS